MSKSDVEPDQIDLSRLKLGPQDAIEQFEAVAREFLPAIFGLPFDNVILTDGSALTDFEGRAPTREERLELKASATREDGFAMWETLMIRHIHDRYGVQLETVDVFLLDLFRTIELTRKASNRQ